MGGKAGDFAAMLDGALSESCRRQPQAVARSEAVLEDNFFSILGVNRTEHA
jgi:hypothetical protein